MTEIASRFEKKLREMGGSSSQLDFDELNILYSYAKDGLPNSFQKVFVDLNYRTTTHSQREHLIKRLVRILEVEKSLPRNEKQSKNNHQSNDALIPKFKVTNEGAERISKLCGDMRKIVLGSTDFDEPHKVRLLNRIAAIEAETQKPEGMFDVVRGGMSDLGETLGKFGKDIKPLTDRMKEVVSIARKGSKQYEQLPEPEEIKRLPAPGATEEDE